MKIKALRYTIYFSKKKGIALIMTVGILALMAIIATTFVVNMQLEQRAAVNYLNTVKARYLAEAGIQKAIADVRKWVKEEDYSSLKDKISAVYPANNETEEDLLGMGSCIVQLEDESLKVNINTFTQTDSEDIDALHNEGGLSYDQIAKIIDYRDPDSKVTTNLYTSSGWQGCIGLEVKVKNSYFNTIEEILLVDGIGNAAYENVKDYISIYKPIIPGGLLASYYKGLQGVSPNVVIGENKFLGKIVELGQIWEQYVDGADGWEETHNVSFEGSYLMNNLGGDWMLDNFAVVYEGYIFVTAEETGTAINFLLFGGDGMKLYIDNELVLDRWYDGYIPESVGSHTFEYAGWHPLKLEYYDIIHDNALELQWKTTVYNQADNCIPAERFGFDPSLSNSCNGAGVYTITSTGRVKSADGDVLAEKKIKAVCRIFGAWSQTERSEFSSVWEGEYGNYSDGEFKWVNWLDTCPTDMDEKKGSVMHWDIINDYGFSIDSLKLGYWDNFDEDVVFSTISVSGLTGYGEIYEQFYDADDMDSDHELSIHCAVQSNEEAIINENYYSSASPGKPMFARTWEQDCGQLKKDSDEWGKSASQRKDDNDQPAPNWCVGYFSIKQSLDAGENITPYNIYLADGDDGFYGGDFFQIYYDGTYSPFDGTVSYTLEKVLGFTCNKENYFQGYLDGTFYQSVGKSALPGDIIDRICLTNINLYDVTNGYPDIETKIGALSESRAHFDNVRVIPEEGFFVSTPFYAGTDVDWGTISWDDETLAGKTEVLLYARTASGSLRSGAGQPHPMPSNDTFTSSYSKGDNISGNGNWVQYKAVLRSTAFETGNYKGSSVTPVLKDVTITYLPEVEVLYWSEVTE